MAGGGSPRLYAELAHGWPLLSPPSHYVEEAADLLALLGPAASARRSLLELGSGSGGLAFHLKPHFDLTLTDRSPQMLAQCRAVNPECEHIERDQWLAWLRAAGCAPSMRRDPWGREVFVATRGPA